MINIAICDDNISICSQIEKILLEYERKNFLKFNIEVFLNGKKIMEYLDLGNKYHILFLDIEIGNIKGVDIGKYIRKTLNNREIKIIYVSSFEKYAMELFDLKPTNFLIKPIDEDKIKEVLEDTLYDLEIQFQEFTFNFKNNMFRVKLKDIIYFETIKLSKNIKLVTIDNEYIFRDNLNKIQESLEKNDFIKINKSLLVNFNYIKVFNPGEYKIILTTEEELPLSKNRLKEIKSRYFQILNERTF